MDEQLAVEKPQALGQDAPVDAAWLVSDVWLRRVIGALWLIDGLLQLQPTMFTMNMIGGIMLPNLKGQPAPIAASLSWIIALTTQNLTLFNCCIVAIQVALGLALIAGRGVKLAAIGSIVWSLVVWYAGEGLSLLLTGQASALTGAPGSVVLYAIFAVAFLVPEDSRALFARSRLRWLLGAFWFGAALLQLQPFWWQDQQISDEIANLYTPGTLSGALVDPSLRWLAGVTSAIEVPLNLSLIVIFSAVGLGLFLAKPSRLKPWLIASIGLSLVIWWFNQGLGMVLTGMATDPNSGPLLVLLALAVWTTGGSRPLTQPAGVGSTRCPP